MFINKRFSDSLKILNLVIYNIMNCVKFEIKYDNLNLRKLNNNVSMKRSVDILHIWHN